MTARLDRTVVPLLVGVLAASGCLEPSSPGAEGEPPANPPAPVRERMEPVDISASVPGGAFVCLPVVSCRDLGFPGLDDWSFFDHEFRNASAMSWNVSLTLTWESNQPGTERLHVVATAYTRCGENCRAWGPRIEAEGVSPLRLEGIVPDTEGTAEGLLVVVEPPGDIHAHVEQPFRLNGTIGVL